MLKKLKIFLFATFITLTLTTNIFAEGNLIKNASFEAEEGGSPTDWTYSTYVKDEGAAEFKIESEGAYSGSSCVTIINNVENDSRYIQTIRAEPNKKYKLSCYIKAENIGDAGNGAVLSVEGQLAVSNTLRNTNGKWEYSEMYIQTGEGIDNFNVTVGIGGYGAMSTGKASFDEVTADEVDSIPAGSSIATLEQPKTDTNNSSSDNDSNTNSGTEKKSGTSKIVWIVLAVCILIVAAATYSTFKSSSSEGSNSSDDTNELPENFAETEAQNDSKSVDTDDSNKEDS